MIEHSSAGKPYGHLLPVLWGAVLFLAGPLHGQTASRPAPLQPGTWRFAVSGDSRNCGDVVMPAIAANSSAHYAPYFYWHLGDLRAISKIDEDMAAEAQKNGHYLSCESYHQRAWPDFVEHQIAPFGITRFYLGVGNHETVAPKGLAQFSAEFQDWLLTPRRQMEAEESAQIKNAKSGPCQKIAAQPYMSAKTYYHWIQGGVDFLNLDNSTGQFPPDELDWFDCVMDRAVADNKIKTLVVGMHQALPYSTANDHSLCDDPGRDTAGCRSGKHVYEALVNLKSSKHVYVLASHSHFFLADIFRREPEKHRLKGWIVGTAGAARRSLPPGAQPGPQAQTDVYGYLVGTVKPDGEIVFEFVPVKESDVPAAVRKRYPQGFTNWCFEHNSQHRDPLDFETTNRCVPPPADRE
jgi:hypothetical protein